MPFAIEYQPQIGAKGEGLGRRTLIPNPISRRRSRKIEKSRIYKRRWLNDLSTQPKNLLDIATLQFRNQQRVLRISRFPQFRFHRGDQK